jgi:putative membrane protein
LPGGLAERLFFWYYYLMSKILYQIAAGIAGIFLAAIILEKVNVEIIEGQPGFLGLKLTAGWQVILIAGTVLGLINCFVKPVLKFITTPVRMLTFGFFSLVINMFLVWMVDFLFPELSIEGLAALFWATAIIWILNFILVLLYKRKKS